MPVPACGHERARAERSRARRSLFEGGVYPRARRSPPEVSVHPRTGRSPPEGGVCPRARRSLRSANSFTAPDTPNRTRSLKFRAPVCRHHHPLQNPFASFIFFHPLVSTPWELSVHIMLRSFSFYLILHSHTIVKNSSSALVFVLMFIRTKADVELFRYQAIAGAPSKSTPCLLSTSTSEVRSWPHAHINLFWVQVSSSLACLMSESQADHHMLYVAGA
jgi:hypothetical protein